MHGFDMVATKSCATWMLTVIQGVEDEKWNYMAWMGFK